jgi:hypothetical protein
VDRDKAAEDWNNDPAYKKPPKNLAEGKLLAMDAISALMLCA